MAARNDVTGDVIATRDITNAYRDNYDAIFGKKKESAPVVEEVPVVEELKQPEVEMTTVYYLTRNNGDGSSSVVFFRKHESAASKLDENNEALESWEWESFCENEEVRSFEIPSGPNTINFQD